MRQVIDSLANSYRAACPCMMQTGFLPSKLRRFVSRKTALLWRSAGFWQATLCNLFQHGHTLDEVVHELDFSAALTVPGKPGLGQGPIPEQILIEHNRVDPRVRGEVNPRRLLQGKGTGICGIDHGRGVWRKRSRHEL